MNDVDRVAVLENQMITALTALKEHNSVLQLHTIALQEYGKSVAADTDNQVAFSVGEEDDDDWDQDQADVFIDGDIHFDLPFSDAVHARDSQIDNEAKEVPYFELDLFIESEDPDKALYILCSKMEHHINLLFSAGRLTDEDAKSARNFVDAIFDKNFFDKVKPCHDPIITTSITNMNSSDELLSLLFNLFHQKVKEIDIRNYVDYMVLLSLAAPRNQVQ